MIKFSEMKPRALNLDKIVKDFKVLIQEFKNAETFAQQDKVLKKVNKFSDELATDMTLISIRFTVNTQDETNKKLQDQLDEISPYISQIFNEFNKELVVAKFRKELEEKYGKHLFNMTENALKCFDEKIIPELMEQNKLTSKYSMILAGAQIEYKGEKYTLAQLAKFADSTDRKVRKEVATLSAKFYEEHDEEIGDIYDKLVKLRTSMAQKLGFKSFTELGYLSLGRTDYDAEMVANYRKQIINDLVPFTQKLFKRQMKRVGIRKPYYYDYAINFLSGNAKPNGNKDFMVEQAKKMYKELSPETDVFFNFLVDYELMDLEAKPGKAPGGYMTYLPKYKAPFIFSNFNGTSGDVDVLTHEFGHAFQGYMSRNINVPDYRSPTLEACEMHSMSMEFLTYPWMNLFFGENEEKYRYSHLADAIVFIPYGCTVDEFQHWVYEHPNATHEERCAKWREIEKSYTPHKQYDECPAFNHGAYWLRQGHIFASPFYYIDYTLAQVCAFQFFVEMRKNHEKAWKKYVKLCKMGGKFPFVTLLENAKLRNPFEEGNVAKVIKPLVKILKEFDTSSF